MAKFCGKCGSRLDEATGLCPNCDAEKIKQSVEKPVEPSKEVEKKPEASQQKATPMSKKEAKAKQKADKKAAKKERKAQKKAAKKAKKKERWAAKTFGQKIKNIILRFVLWLVLINVFICCSLGALAYYDFFYIPVVSDIFSEWQETGNTKNDFHNLTGEFSSIVVSDEKSAVAVAQEAARILGLENAADELILNETSPVDNVIYYRLNQTYSGIPVYGRTMVVITDNTGKVKGFTSNGYDIHLESDLEAAVSFDEAKSAVESYLKKEYRSNSVIINSLANNSLTIYTFSGSTALLAYDFIAAVDGILYEVIIDADSSNILKCIKMDYTQLVIGSGLNNDGENTTFNVNLLADGGYLLEDLERNIRVYNANNSTVSIGNEGYYVVDSKGNYYTHNGTNWVDKTNTTVTVNSETLQGSWKIIANDGSIVDENAYLALDLYAGDNKIPVHRSSSTTFEDRNAVSLINGTQITYDFFRNCLNRIGFDNQNGSMSVAYNNTAGAYSSGIAQDNPVALLAFGAENILDIDLIAHEYMHSVERSISGMIYENESGAIMEAYSDLFGEIVEDYSDGDLNGNCDWLHEAYVELGYNHSRSLSNPNESGNPAHVREDSRTFLQKFLVDKKEVHHCSTIVSHAAYLMANSSLAGENLAINEIASLWYHTLFTLPANCSFIELRAHMEIASEIVGLSQAKKQRVQSTFDEVGIANQSSTVITYNSSLSINVFDKTGNKYSDYTLQIEGIKDLPLWFTEEFSRTLDGTSASLAVELDKGTYTLTVTDKNGSPQVYEKNIKIKKKSENSNLNFATLYAGVIQPPIRTTSNERDIVLVLDVSGSMSGTPMAETKKASVNFIDTILDEDASIGIVTYDNSASMLADFSMNETALTTAFSSIYDGGGTNIESGLAQARSMLNTSNAKKKIIVLMSDGEPNDGKEGDDLIAYADDIKEDGIIIYTLGFFESLGSYKSSAQILMEGIASDGCHYEVASADDLVFFFEDVADQINGQKYIYIRIACPVDVSVSYNGETLNSAKSDLSQRTEFGTLTYEENENTSANTDDRIKILRLKEGVDYNIQIVGTGRGIMDYTIGFMDADGNYSDLRKFENIKITKKTIIDTVAKASDETVLNIDEDGDGKYDIKYRAEENGFGEEIDSGILILVVIGISSAAIMLIILILLKTIRRKHSK